MAKSSFQKFQNKEEKGAKLKERIRQEKKKVRQETKEYFAQQKAKRTPVQLVTKAGPAASCVKMPAKAGQTSNRKPPRKKENKAVKCRSTNSLRTQVFVRVATQQTL